MSTQHTLDSTDTITMYQVTKTEITLNPLYRPDEPFVFPGVNSHLMRSDPALESMRQFVFPGHFAVSGPEVFPAVITSGGMKAGQGRRRSLPNLRSIASSIGSSIYSRRSSSSSIKTTKSEPNLPSILKRESSLANFRSKFSSISSSSSRKSSVESTTTTESEPIPPASEKDYRWRDWQPISLQEFLNHDREEERRKCAPDVLCGDHQQDSSSKRTLGEYEELGHEIGIYRRKARRHAKEAKGMDLSPIWTETYDLDLPYAVQRDKSELDFLRRRNKLAADGVMAIDDDEDEVMIDAPVYKLIVTRH